MICLSYDSYYRRSEEVESLQDMDTGKQKEKKTRKHVDFAGPLLFWICILVIAAALQLVAIPFAARYNRIDLVGDANLIATYIFVLPGYVILPLIVSLWMGSNIGAVLGKDKMLVSRSLFYALSVIIMYMVFIFLIYSVFQMRQIAPLGYMPLFTFGEFLIVIPSLMVLILTPIISAISSLDKRAV